ncbi:MAG TPA: TonB-dependent receptor, partial [Mariniphaga sp.]|nr:TonB-dependent receptor [Mariniphaga sp.]
MDRFLKKRKQMKSMVFFMLLVLISWNSYSQDIAVQGKVSDAAGEPLIGVNVVEAGTLNGTITDVNGGFTLKVSDSNATLKLTYIGYEPQTLELAGRSQVDIVMQESTSELDEVVVVGYGTQKKVTITGSVDAIAGEEIQNRSAVLVSDLIKGASPNLNITMGMRGGEPGATSSWNIRGLGSISANASPLILVDGVEVNINNIDPETIESISVLKDASASAIYGSRAPFGVVLITTKKGTEGKVNIEYTNNVSMNSPIGVPDFVDALTWATAYNQANANAGIASPVYSDEQMERIKGYLDGTFPYEYDPENPVTNIWAGRRIGNANYNWPKELLADYSVNHKHHLNLSGGTERTNYFLSGGYVSQDGIYRYAYDNYSRVNLLSNVNSQVTDWLNVRTSIKYAKGMSDYPVGQTTVGREHMIGEMLTFAPMMPKYNINGSIQSPLLRWQQDSGRDKWQSTDFSANFGADIEPVKGWVTSFSYNHNAINARSFSHPKPVMVELGDGSFGNVGKPSSSWGVGYNTTGYTLINAITSYQANLGDHYFNGLVGYEQEDRNYSSISATGTGLITDEVPSLKTALGEKSVSDAMNHWATQGVFGRLNYNYKEKYLFEFSARYNGSSRFSADTRWGFFPSASVGYAISNENFWQPIEPIINTFKVRASYGSLGNQNVGLYSYLTTMGVGAELNWIIDGQRPQYVNPPGIVSSDLTWETITTANVGFDAGFINNRLQVVFDMYERITTNMLGPAETLPYPLGVSAPQRNNAELSNRGFELVLTWRDRVTSDFSYDAKVSIGDSKATILEYYNEKEIIDTWYPGKVVGEIWGYTTDGIIQEVGEEMPDQSKFYSKWGPGDIKYKNLTEGDNKIDDGTRTINDHGDLTVIGNTTPRYNFSISGGFNWKNFDFNMFWQGVGKRDYYPHASMMVFWGMTNSYGSSSVLKDSPILDYWRPADETNILGPNTDAYFAKPYFSSETNKNRQVQTRFLLNAAYMRLKTLQLGYTLPAHISQRAYLQRARIYVSGENLLTLTGLPGTFDPETTIASDP